MKTPREILLNRHREQTAQLDALRTEVIGTLRSNPATDDREEPVGFLVQAWRELFVRYRRTWLAMATVLGALGALHVSIDAPESSGLAARPLPPPAPLEINGQPVLYAHSPWWEIEPDGWTPRKPAARDEKPPAVERPRSWLSPIGRSPEVRHG